MRTLIDLVRDLGAGRSRGIIYAETPFGARSHAVVHDPWSVLGPPPELEAFLDADLAHEYLRAWSAWQPSRPSPEAAVEALVAFAARPSNHAVGSLERGTEREASTLPARRSAPATTDR